MRQITICSSILFCIFTILNNVAFAEEFSHTALTNILQQVVHEAGPGSTVDYAQLAKDTTSLNAYLEKMAVVSTVDFRSWPAESQLAFLINAYNAAVLKLVAEEYPIKSIQDLSDEKTSVWKKKFVNLFGKPRSLDFIEHELIRKRFKEPRIHFALVCAAISCPPLRNEAYQANSLMQTLEEQQKRFLADPTRNYVDGETNTLYLSKIFSWFTDDFLNFSPARRVSLTEYLDPYFRDEYRAGNPPQIRFLPYDWALNEYAASGKN